MRTLIAAGVFGTALVQAAFAQVPQGTGFTYQGRLTEGGALADGPYDFQFVLFDAPTDGAQVGPSIALEDVAVTEGLFIVTLDFGSVFGSQKRFLELGVRPGADTGAYTPILPRQELTPGPSALFSAGAADAQALGGVPASQFVQTDDPRMTDPRDPLPGSPDYVQNGSVPQPGVSFNVGGTGVADVLDAGTQYNLGGARILGNPGIHNLFAGTNAGVSNTSGNGNSFFGRDAGLSNTTGSVNAFFGDRAGLSNTTGSFNAFFGAEAGRNTTGDGNAFFGSQAGRFATTGLFNSLFGSQAGANLIDGSANAMFGASAGGSSNGTANSYFGEGAGPTDTTGSNNTFVGFLAGLNNTTGSNNTFVGNFTSLGNSPGASDNTTLLGSNARAFPNLSNATALGANALVAQSNSLVLGAVEGTGPGTNVGIGTPIPTARLHIVDGGGRSIQLGASPGCTGFIGIAFQTILPNCQDLAIFGGDGETHINRLLGRSIFFKENNVTQVTIKPGGVLNLQSLGSAGATPLCRNASNDVSTCSSSLRYKSDVATFRGGLELVEHLRPIRFTWKSSGRPDIGLAAEEVAEVHPLLAFRNDRGEIEGVNYSQLTAVLVNALQQQEERLQSQGREIEALRASLCLAMPQAPCCSR
jgi:hypothetical protein